MPTTRKFQKKVGWGEALLLEVHYRSPGLKSVVEAIRKAAGLGVGSRNTFAKLFDVDDVPTDPKDRFRAWLLLTALGQDPSDWHIADDAVPAGYDAERLRTLVRSWSRWIPTCPGQTALDLTAA